MLVENIAGCNNSWGRGVQRTTKKEGVVLQKKFLFVEEVEDLLTDVERSMSAPEKESTLEKWAFCALSPSHCQL